MARQRIRVNDKVIYKDDGQQATVLEVKRGGYVIRTAFGYRREVKATDVQLLEEAEAS